MDRTVKNLCSTFRIYIQRKFLILSTSMSEILLSTSPIFSSYFTSEMLSTYHRKKEEITFEDVMYARARVCVCESVV